MSRAKPRASGSHITRSITGQFLVVPGGVLVTTVPHHGTVGRASKNATTLVARESASGLFQSRSTKIAHKPAMGAKGVIGSGKLAAAMRSAVGKEAVTLLVTKPRKMAKATARQVAEIAKAPITSEDRDRAAALAAKARAAKGSSITAKFRKA